MNRSLPDPDLLRPIADVEDLHPDDRDAELRDRLHDLLPDPTRR